MTHCLWRTGALTSSGESRWCDMPDVDVASARPHAHASDEAALYELVGVMPHDLPVLTCARLRLISIDHQV